MKKVDKYGNNTNFPNEVLSDMTTKGLLGKWCNMILSHIVSDVCKYRVEIYLEGHEYTEIKSNFLYTYRQISHITPILEDLTNINLYGLDDIFLAVYGINSKEVRILREHKRLLRLLNKADDKTSFGDGMWSMSTEEFVKVYEFNPWG